MWNAECGTRKSEHNGEWFRVSGKKMTSEPSEIPAFGVYVGVGLRSRRAARGGVPVA